MTTSAIGPAGWDYEAKEGTDRSGVRRFAAAQRRTGGHFALFASGMRTMLGIGSHIRPSL